MRFYSSLWCMLLDLSNGGNLSPALMSSILACGGPVEVAHLGPRAGWRRGKDAETAPLCRKHHRAIDGTVGGRAPWYVALGRDGQRELREKLVRFAGYYWDGLAPYVRQRWNEHRAAV
jgi:hypothetical protein